MDADLFPVSFEEISVSLSSPFSYPNEQRCGKRQDRENVAATADRDQDPTTCELPKPQPQLLNTWDGKPYYQRGEAMPSERASGTFPPSRIPRLRRPTSADCQRSIDQSAGSVASEHSNVSRESGIAARAAQRALRQLDENAVSPEIPQPPVIFDFEKKIRSRSRPGSPTTSRPSQSRSQSPVQRPVWGSSDDDNGSSGHPRQQRQKRRYCAVGKACRELRTSHAAMRTQVRQFLQTGCALLQTFGEAIVARCDQESKSQTASEALDDALAQSQEWKREATVSQAAATEWRRRALVAEQAAQERLETIRMQKSVGVLSSSAAVRNALQDARGGIRVFARIRTACSGETNESAFHLPGTSPQDGKDALVLRDDGSSPGEDTRARPAYEDLLRGCRRVSKRSALPDSESGGSAAAGGGQEFLLDRVWDPSVSQDCVFGELRPFLQSALRGKCVTILAYGHTGSGKTFTLDGPPGEIHRYVADESQEASPSSSLEDAKSSVGVVSRALAFFMRAKEGRESVQSVHLAVFEVYNERVRDLLESAASRKPRGPAPSRGSGGTQGPQILRNVRTIQVDSLETGERLLRLARRQRSSASTDCNEHSSRSHLIVQLLIAQARGSALVQLVDLAGSERLRESHAEGTTRTETCHVNRSLSALGSVVCALAERKSHVPYRNSTLTKVLEPSLRPGAQTAVILTLADGSKHRDDNLRTLRFGSKLHSVDI